MADRVSTGAEFDSVALDLVNQIEATPADWHPTRRKAHAQVLIVEALRRHAQSTPSVELLTAIAAGYKCEGKCDRYIIVDNPAFQEDTGSDPKLVFDTWTLAVPSTPSGTEPSDPSLPLAVRLRDEEGPPLPQMVAQRRAQLAASPPQPAPDALAILDAELKYYQEENDRKNLTEVGQHAFSVLRRIRQRIGDVVGRPVASTSSVPGQARGSS